ncbi:MAG TPA: outer membrane protein assembly factor BamA [Bacteroidia bacterium]|nr:outer membrane protein assembly factor BamA [Bacteroidia bacterium]HNU34318.1 outer membrane protein assembly factor BamA [Bacteroidia bacterium]
MLKKLLFLLFSISFSTSLFAQIQLGNDSLLIDYSNPTEYEIAGITVTGIRFLDESALKTLSGLKVGDKVKIPGDKMQKAIENLWKQGILTDVKIVANRIEGKLIFIELKLQERPRLSKFAFNGVRKGEADKLRETIQLQKGKVLSENLVITITNQVNNFFKEKGFLNVSTSIRQLKDSAEANSNIVFIEVNKGSKVKIKKINIDGNSALTDGKLKRSLKNTKEKVWWKIFTSSKFREEEFVTDKEKLISKYNEKGYRDAKIVSDTVYSINSRRINIDIKVDEGNQYFFRNITFLGNTKYTSEELKKIVGINPGDVYNAKRLESALYMSEAGRDVTSLYMDDGYLFFNIDPVEVLVEGDSIDLEMRIYEGKQATINKVIVKGNTKTNDRVIMREIRTKPGQLFSRTDIIRTQRELSQLGYFNPEKLGVNPKPNPETGTVDIEYEVEEKPSDQLELSGGYGANQLVGTLGVTFNNFSARNISNWKSYSPLPSGDGQRISVRATSNGRYYQSYNASFTEPWLGGKKPNALTVSFYRSIQTNGRKKSDELRQAIFISGVSVGLQRRLKWPDDYFTYYSGVNFQIYNLKNYRSTFLFSDGTSNNFSFEQQIGRNSIDQPIYPRKGSEISLTLQLTPPYSLLNNKDYSTAEDKEKYKWIEYHKWKFNTTTYTKLIGNLVLYNRAQFGFLGLYNRTIGQSPFERFYLGGDGLSGFSLDGREIVSLRGYDNNSITPEDISGNNIGGTIFNKFTMELRYPMSLNPSATIYGLAFVEGGNNWLKFKEYSPFNIKRSAGVGIRIFLPMFGLLGLDYGWPFDTQPGSTEVGKTGQFHFTIGQQF